MNTHHFSVADTMLHALPSGALWWEEERLLCVSDLHLGKAERMARRGGGLLPPYECQDTLQRLDDEVARHGPAMVICLGDSFDDLVAADGMEDGHRLWIMRLMAGREWVWIAGNHDPAPVDMGGRHLSEYRRGPLTFRHIASEPGQRGEVSGHFHPKAGVGRRGAGMRRPCFLTDGRRLILPAFGTYTGGMDVRSPELRALMGPRALAILTGPTPVAFPVPA